MGVLESLYRRTYQYFVLKFRSNPLWEDKTFVFIVCSMRSGSTLLKSLLAMAPDTSHLPEVNFEKYTKKEIKNLIRLDPARILILKSPAWYKSVKTYPKIPKIQNAKYIILVRDVYNTVKSIEKMNENVSTFLKTSWSKEQLVNDYWYTLYHNVLQRNRFTGKQAITIRYEDLVQEPEIVTKRLFSFIGSEQKRGVMTYAAPTSYDWQWGMDDGGEKIKTLSVQRPDENYSDKELLAIIKASPKVLKLRAHYGYEDLP